MNGAKSGQKNLGGTKSTEQRHANILVFWFVIPYSLVGGISGQVYPTSDLDGGSRVADG
jgi:hypothetical protein